MALALAYVDDLKFTGEVYYNFGEMKTVSQDDLLYKNVSLYGYPTWIENKKGV